jgi:hypothetical protein
MHAGVAAIIDEHLHIIIENATRAQSQSMLPCNVLSSTEQASPSSSDGHVDYILWP